MVGTALGCSIAIMAAGPGTAWAGDECGDDVGGAITCTATSGVGNPYPGGIVYFGDAGEDITVVVDGTVAVNSGGSTGVFVGTSTGNDANVFVDDGATITTTGSGIRMFGYVTGSDAYAYNAGDITAGIRGMLTQVNNADATTYNAGSVTVNGGSNGSNVAIGVQANATGVSGVAAVMNTGDVTVNGSAGDAFTRGLEVGATQGVATIHNGGSVDVTGVGGNTAIGAGLFAGQYVGFTSSADSAIDVSSVTGYAYGVYAHAYNGAADVQVNGEITVTTAGTANGIHVRAATTAYVSAGDINVTGVNGAAIFVSSIGQTTVVDSGDIVATGADLEGILAYSSTGVAITSTGTISTDGANAEGIRGRGYGVADVVIEADDVTTLGLNSEGIIGYADANISITDTGLISTTGDNSYGVLGRTFGAGEVYVSVNEITTTGQNSEGVWAFGNNDVTIVASGDVSTEGDNSRGLYAGSYGAGLVTINAADVFTTGYDSDAIWATSNDGAVSINFNSVTTTASGSEGVVGIAETGVGITGGDVIAAGYGVYARTSFGDIDIDVGDIQSAKSGVNAIANAGYVDVTTGAITIETYGYVYGVYAQGGTGAAISVTGDISVSTGEGGATGVYAQVDAGPTSIVVVGDTVVTASGDAVGIEEHGAADGAVVDVTGSISATSSGADAYGVLATATFGLIDIGVTGAITADAYGDAFGVYANFAPSEGPPPPPPPPPPPGQVEGSTTAAFGDPQSIDISVGGLITAASSNGDATGVFAETYAGDIYVGANGGIIVTSQTAAAEGIEATTTYGDIDIIVTGGIDVTGAGDSFGIVASSAAPYIEPPYYYYDRGAVVAGGPVFEGTRAIDISVTGPTTVYSSGGDATGVSAIGYDNVTVATGDVSAISPYGEATGILATSLDTDVSVTVVGDIDVQGQHVAYGVLATAQGGVTVDVSGDIDATAGSSAYGVRAHAANGDVSVTVGGGIDVYGAAYAAGVSASAGNGQVYVSVDDVTAIGGRAFGIAAFGRDGVEVISTGLIYSSGNGVRAYADHGDASVMVVDVNAGGYGVDVRGYGDATIVSTGDTTAGGTGLGAFARYGDASVTSSGDVLTVGQGIIASSQAGDASVISTGTVTTTGTAATGVSGTAGDQVHIDVAAVSTSGQSAVGIYASANGDIDITFDSVRTTGGALLIGSFYGEGGGTYFTYAGGSDGIVADSNDGAVSIIGGDVFTGGDGAEGIVASGFGSVLIDVGTVQTQGDLLRAMTAGEGSVITYDASTAAIGIDASVLGGDLSIYAGAVYTSGDFATGILATSLATSVYDYSGYARPRAPRITVSGDVLVDVGVVQTLGDSAEAIHASNSGGQTVVIADAVYTFGDNSNGVFAQAVSYADIDPAKPLLVGDVSVDVGKARTYGDESIALYAVSEGGDVFVGGDNILTTGDGSDGVYALANTTYDYNAEATLAGDATVDVGIVTTRGDFSTGVRATAIDGDVDVTADDVYTGGDYALGIDVTAGGDATVTAASVVTYGDYSDGLRAQVTGAGRATIVVGNVGVYGYGSDAVAGFAGGDGEGGDVYVTVTGIVSSAYGTGVRAEAAGYASITVDHGQVSGAYAGIVSTAGIATLIDNDHGFIYGDGGLAIQVNGGFAQIDNAGVIYGRVDLTDNADSFTNSGVFEAYGTSAFGAGADVFSNIGTTGFSRSNGAASTTTFTGLESFDNTGRVSGLDGQAGDVLAMAGTVFHGGTGSQLALDVQFGGPGSIADRIVIGQATGVTTIVPNSVLSATPGVLNFAGILVVDSAFANQTGAEFTMTPVDRGFVDYSLRFDAAQDNWLIVALPDASAFRLLALSAAVQDFWQRSDRAVISHWQESRDSDGGARPGAGPSDGSQRGDGWEMWMQGHAGDEGFTDSETFTIGGTTFVENQSHNSDWRGFQFGADDRMGAVTWGLTGGFVQQETRFDVGGESFDIEGWNAGAYVSWMSNGFFANVLAKGDFNTIDANLTNVADMEAFDAQTLGLQGELGYRFTSDSTWFVEPVANLSWSTTKIDSFTASGATVDFGDSDSLLGRAGLRFGATMGSGAVILTPALGVFAISEFEGENSMTFTTGGTGFSVTDTPPGTYGQVQFGVTAQTFYGLEGYVRGEWNVGGDAEGGAVRLGARWRW